ncbi:MAG: ATP-dependent Clp protease ATP-binding subunit [Lachnospiraceae bacterium]|nr:ATP-dependent Clp protease ATP-binding subunit [Lachnospiraceae bacterium]
MKYTDKAKQVLELARKCASELHANYVGTEHILVGLLREGSGVAFYVLNSNKIQEKQILELIDQLVAPGNVLVAEGNDLTPRAEKVLKMSAEAAARFKSDAVGTEHILLSLIREGDNIAVRLLNTLGAQLPKIYAETLDAIGEDPQLMRKDLKNNGGEKASATPMLDQYSRDLTALAAEDGLDPVIGRENEIMRVVQILSRRTKNNPCLVGEPGVGKTAIAEGLALRIARGSVPVTLKDKRVVSLDMSGMVAGSKYRGEFEERIKRVIAEVINAGNVIIFMDEIHTLIGAGSAEGTLDASNILKPSMARGEVQLIGATTHDEYRKYIEKDAALERRFQPVTVEEPTEEETVEILMGIKYKYEEHHGIIIPEETVREAVALSSRYINDRFRPDKAIDVIDEAASHLKLESVKESPAEEKLLNEIKKKAEEKEEAIKNGDFAAASAIKKAEEKDQKKLKALRLKKKKEGEDDRPVLSVDDVAEIVHMWTKIPVTRLTEKENKRLMRLEDTLHKRIIGQDEAVEKVAKAVRRGRVGLKDPNRPIGSFLFLGPTGVGKTELCKALAETLFGTEKDMIRVDMSEFMESHSVAKMIGSPPGYVGHDEGGQLAEKIRRHPFSVVLFDEIEKAHPDVFNVLLQVLDDGHITDSKGRKVSFKNSVIIMTSNAGAKSIVEPKKLGFNAGEKEEDLFKDMKSGVMEEVKRIFKPEFLNRIDDIIVFRKLNDKDMKDIVTLLSKDLVGRAKENLGITLKLPAKVKEFVIEKGIDRKYGARPLKRAIQNMIEDPLSEEILSGKCVAGDTVTADIKDDKIIFIAEKGAESGAATKKNGGKSNGSSKGTDLKRGQRKS